MAYRMVQLPMTLSDVKGHFCSRRRRFHATSRPIYANI